MRPVVYLIIGNNTYRAEQELHAIIARSGLVPERIDVERLDDVSLADIVRGATLFASERLVVISQLSEAPHLFEKLAKWADDLSESTTLVVLETKVDRRTKAYKTLSRSAKLIPADSWTEYETEEAEAWLAEYATKQQVALSSAQVKSMVRRAFIPGEKPTQRMIDQMILARSIATLRDNGTVTDEMIATILPPVASDTIFDLLTAAAHRDYVHTTQLLRELQRSEDPYAAFAIIMGQWAQLAAVSLASGGASAIAVELGIHPFVAKNLFALTREFQKIDIKELTHLAATLDVESKRSQFAPWDGLERFIYAIVLRSQ